MPHALSLAVPVVSLDVEHRSGTKRMAIIPDVVPRISVGRGASSAPNCGPGESAKPTSSTVAPGRSTSADRMSSARPLELKKYAWTITDSPSGANAIGIEPLPLPQHSGRGYRYPNPTRNDTTPTEPTTARPTSRRTHHGRGGGTS